jgi:hypothetical protein
MASVVHVDEWVDECVSVTEVEQALIGLRLRRGFVGKRNLRTTVLTHIAWVPAEWQEEAAEALAGLAEGHPSRTLLLFPQPEAADGISARALLECYEVPFSDRHLCNEVVELRLRGNRAEAPASVVLPLLLPDLPVFLRWRGRPPFATDQFGQLAELVDRLIVDSAEWPDVPGAYEELDDVFERTATSDIAWRRTLPWRQSLADAWPEVPERVAAPAAEAALVAGWLRSRTGADVTVEQADDMPFAEAIDASELLSAELDVFRRDPIYEAAVRAAGE